MDTKTEELINALNKAEELITAYRRLHGLLKVTNELLESQQKQIDYSRNFIKALVHINKGKVTFSFDDFTKATAPGTDFEFIENEGHETITLTLIKRTVQ